MPPEDEITQVASTWLAEQTAAIEGAEGVQLSGHPASTVCDWAHEHHRDLLIAGAHHGRLERIALGSFASHLAHHPGAVLLVRPAGS